MDMIESYSERQFLDELYEIAQRIEPEKRDEEVAHVFEFASINDGFRFQRKVMEKSAPPLDADDVVGLKMGLQLVSPRMKAYLRFTDDFERIGILKTSFMKEADKITISYTPRDYIDFYNQRFGIKEKTSEEGSLSVFTFTDSGALSRRNPLSNDKTYCMEEDSDRYNLMRSLVGHSRTGRYVQTINLAEELKITERRVRSAVSELRKQFNKNFRGIRNKDIIDAKKGSGYRINPKVQIIQLS